MSRNDAAETPARLHKATWATGQAKKLGHIVASFFFRFVSVVLFVGVTLNRIDAAELIPLGEIPLGYNRLLPRGLSDDGNVVVGNLSYFEPGVGTTRGEAFRWTRETGIEGLGCPRFEDDHCRAEAISADGSMIVGSSTVLLEEEPIFDYEPFIYTEQNGFTQVDVDRFAGGSVDIAADGSALTGTRRTGPEEAYSPTAFRWTEEQGAVDLGTLPGGTWTQPNAISPDGSIIVGKANYRDGIFKPHGSFLWTEDGGIERLFFDGFEGAGEIEQYEVTEVTNGATVLAGYGKFLGDTENQAFRWTEATGVVGLGWLEDTVNEEGKNRSLLRDMTDDGSLLIGSSGYSAAVSRGFIWSEQYGLEDLRQALIERHAMLRELEGWKLQIPYRISGNGQFMVGYDVTDEGEREAWLVRLDVPFLNLPGDFNLDGVIDVTDIDQLTEAIRIGTADQRFDRDRSGVVDLGDLDFLVKTDLATWYGDANLDGKFNTGDLVRVFEAGKYETPQDAGWGEGDWNGDGVFGTGDLVKALEDGGYEMGPRQNALAVPEPGASVLLLVGIVPLVIGAARRRRGTLDPVAIR